MRSTTSPLTVLVSPNSFKECLNNYEVAEIMAKTAQASGDRRWQNANYLQVPLGDGGEGSLDALLSADRGYVPAEYGVPNAMGELVYAAIGFNEDTETAFVESAQALSLAMLEEEVRDIGVANSYGLGLMIFEALNLGAKNIILALGDSATNDGGAGLLSALGAKFYDREGRELPPFPRTLGNLSAVDLRGLDPRLKTTRFEVARDVDNPLLGPEGASATFGPQKGASEAQVQMLESTLKKLSRAVISAQKFAAKAEGETAPSIPSQVDTPGAGAAGGLGWCALQVLNATPIPGFEMISEAVDYDTYLKHADVVFTGEGRLDAQTLRGKTVMGVVQKAQAQGVPVVVFVGAVGPGWEQLNALDGVSIVGITAEGTPKDEALEHCAENLAEAVAQYVRSHPA